MPINNNSAKMIVEEVTEQTLSNQKCDLPKILIVDDEPRVLRSLETALKSEFNVSVASDAIEAQEIMNESEQFDVIVSDERMPKCPGHIFLKWAKDNHPFCVRILLSSLDFRPIRESIYSADVYKCLSKPWNIQELKVILDQAVLRSRELARQEEKEQLTGTSQQCAIAVLDHDKTYRETYELIGQNMDGISGTYILDTPEDIILAMSHNTGIGIVFIDLSIGETNAANLIRDVNDRNSSVSIIVTATPASITSFMPVIEKLHVFQYITKPTSEKRIQPIVLSAAEEHLHRS